MEVAQFPESQQAVVEKANKNAQLESSQEWRGKIKRYRLVVTSDSEGDILSFRGLLLSNILFSGCFNSKENKVQRIIAPNEIVSADTVRFSWEDLST